MASEAQWSRDFGIDYGGYDNDGSSGQSSAAFLQDRLEQARFDSALPGDGAWDARASTYGIPALIDAGVRAYQANRAAAVQMAANQVNGTFAGYDGRTRIVPQPGVSLQGGGPMGMDPMMLLMLAAAGVAVFMLAKD